MILNKDQIFAAQDLQVSYIDIPEWGGQIKVKEMSAADRIEFEKQQSSDLKPSEMIVRLVLMTCVDDNNQRIFSNDDLQALEQKSPSILLKIFNESMKINILNSEKIEEKAENFPNDHS